MAATRSPLKDRPLNLPGQSIDIALDQFVENHFVLPLVIVFTLTMVTVWEWYASLRHLPRQPWIFVSLSVVAIMAVVGYWRLMWNKAKALRLGRDGERAVGQFLDSHVEGHATVFHDIPTSYGNIDHVVICSRGIYAIETKTRTKPGKGDAKVVVEGDCLQVAGKAPARDPIVQAQTCARSLREVLRASTGRAFDVRPVVVFPGWFVVDQRPAGAHVWVLEPKQLPARILRETEAIPESDVSMATYHLSRYVRTYQR